MSIFIVQAPENCYIALQCTYQIPSYILVHERYSLAGWNMFSSFARDFCKPVLTVVAQQDNSCSN